MLTTKFARALSHVAALGAALLAFGALASCAGATPGARPHDMSAEQHQEMAAREEAQAAGHQAQFDPGAAEDRTKCRTAGGRSAGSICWSSIANPTKEHLRDAEEHRRRAADHRAAAQALKDAEARACVGIEPDDRDISPFWHREDIARVEPLMVSASAPATATPAPAVRGATIYFRAVPGLTAESFQRVIDCHLARNAAMGHDASEMPYCPLMPKNVSATVTSTGDGFAVAVRSDDPAGAAEVLRRAQSLVARPR